MKSILIAALLTLTIAALPNVAAGGSSASATVMVMCTIPPDMAVTPLEAVADAGIIRTGAFSITCDYEVRANMQNVQLFVEQSPLFKAGDPTGNAVAPIPIDTSKGVTVQPANGNAKGGHGNMLTFVGNGAAIQGFQTLKTEVVTFSSRQNGVFNQQVGVTCWWSQPDPQKPPGEYSGVVRLTSLAMPPAG
jgi:hypothetical protein